MKKKGITDAILAIKEANKQKEGSFYLDIYGPIDNEYENEFYDVLEDNKKYVKYCGVIDSFKSVETIKKYDLLLFPTRFDTEGLPGTIIDAFSSAVPTIYSDWKYCNEFFVDKENGIKFKMGDVSDLSNILINYYNKEYNLKQLKNNCLSSAEKYKPEEAIKSLIEILR